MDPSHSQSQQQQHQNTALSDKQKAHQIWDSTFDPRDVQTKNVTSSIAGAGSGDFHVYRSQRRKELLRIQKLETEAKNKEEDLKFQAMLKEKKTEQEIKSLKKAQKRKKKKEKKRIMKKSKRADRNTNNNTKSDSSSEVNGGHDGAFSHSSSSSPSPSNP